jgi:hypothetical protein
MLIRKLERLGDGLALTCGDAWRLLPVDGGARLGVLGARNLFNQEALRCSPACVIAGQLPEIYRPRARQNRQNRLEVQVSRVVARVDRAPTTFMPRVSEVFDPRLVGRPVVAIEQRWVRDCAIGGGRRSWESGWESPFLAFGTWIEEQNVVVRSSSYDVMRPWHMSSRLMAALEQFLAV